MTIQQEFGSFKGLKVAIIGDISHSRVARSNADALTRLGAKVFFPDQKNGLNSKYKSGRYKPIDEAVATADVVMLYGFSMNDIIKNGKIFR